VSMATAVLIVYIHIPGSKKTDPLVYFDDNFGKWTDFNFFSLLQQKFMVHKN